MTKASSAVRAVLLRILFLLLVVMGIFAGIVGCMQRKMIYHPRPYSGDLLSTLPDRMVRVPYEVDGKPQVAFYLPPKIARDDGEPAPLWVLFHGNASVALWWLRWIEEDVTHGDQVGWLLVDYPGYGLNEGHPSRKSIVGAVETILPAFAKQSGTTTEELEENLSVMGFSLGAAAALELAVRHPVRHVILLAPFTSLESMARRTVGWPLSNLLIDRFDNVARLEQLAATSPGARVVIIHGDRDSVVPLTHGQQLANLNPAMIRLVPVPGADHVDVLDPAAQVLREVMAHDRAIPLP